MGDQEKPPALAVGSNHYNEQRMRVDCRECNGKIHIDGFTIQYRNSGAEKAVNIISYPVGMISYSAGRTRGNMQMVYDRRIQYRPEKYREIRPTWNK